MLQTLTIENYALIEKLHISFPSGLSIITGETGAGKSILLGALSFILGQRADILALKDPSRNCVVEGEFSIEGYGLEPLFEHYEIEYDPHTIIRRIINPAGKSRAFVNEIPVTLNVLKDISDRLIDIHSQHQNLLLGTTPFQMAVVDAQAGHTMLLADYRKIFNAYKVAASEWQSWKERAERAKADYDYLQFQYDELRVAQLKQGEQKELEDESKQLQHAEEIKSALVKADAVFSGEELSVENLLREAINALQRIAHVLPAVEALVERINSCRIELNDAAGEVEQLNEKITANPDRLLFIENRLNTIYSLQQKHRLTNEEELIALQNKFEKELHDIENFDQTLANLQKKCEAAFSSVQTMAAKLTTGRKQVKDAIEKHIVQMLKLLGMPHASFFVSISDSDQYSATGKNDIAFLFSANKEMAPQEISKVASGGEMSRLMLCLKSLMVKNSGLPTIIFDEIDTGVSGEVADKMGDIIHELSKSMQVINITHLPQIATKGNAHYEVYKEENAAGATVTRIKSLTEEERVMHIARMLSGKNITQAAIDNAKELLKHNHQ